MLKGGRNEEWKGEGKKKNKNHSTHWSPFNDASASGVLNSSV